MSNAICNSPKITIFDENKIMLHESVCSNSEDNLSLKNLADSLKTLQKDVNNFLTTVVEAAQQKTSNKNGVKDNEEDDDDDDDDEDEDDSKHDNSKNYHRFHRKRQRCR